MNTEITIRRETSSDYPAIFEVVKEAFAHAEYADQDEHFLVERLRKSDAYIPELSLVAEMDGNVVGHIMFTKIKVGEHDAITLAPLAVLPGLQGKGIGGKLIEAAHKEAKRLGHEFSVLLGHAGYYPRFGYRRASEYGILSPLKVPDDAFMAIRLQSSRERLDGIVEYAKEFFEA